MLMICEATWIIVIELFPEKEFSRETSRKVYKKRTLSYIKKSTWDAQVYHTSLLDDLQSFHW